MKDVLDKYRLHPDFLGVDLVDVNQKGAVDDAPLHIAARSGSEAEVVVLINNGANVNQAGDLGNTPLHYAAMTGSAGVAGVLLDSGADASARNEFGQSASEVAELSGYQGLADRLGKIQS